MSTVTIEEARMHDAAPTSAAPAPTATDKKPAVEPKDTWTGVGPFTNITNILQLITQGCVHAMNTQSDGEATQADNMLTHTAVLSEQKQAYADLAAKANDNDNSAGGMSLGAKIGIGIGIFFCVVVAFATMQPEVVELGAELGEDAAGAGADALESESEGIEMTDFNTTPPPAQGSVAQAEAQGAKTAGQAVSKAQPRNWFQKNVVDSKAGKYISKSKVGRAGWKAGIGAGIATGMGTYLITNAVAPNSDAGTKQGALVAINTELAMLNKIADAQNTQSNIAGKNMSNEADTLQTLANQGQSAIACQATIMSPTGK